MPWSGADDLSGRRRRRLKAGGHVGNYNVWIEAEAWIPGAWSLHDGNTDVTVTFADGTPWFATFFTYANVATLVEKNKRTGECLYGRYFWAAGMILVDEVSRERIEEVVAHLIETRTFASVFKKGEAPGSPQVS